MIYWIPTANVGKSVGNGEAQPFLGVCYAAEAFLSTWQDELPFGRPLAS